MIGGPTLWVQTITVGSRAGGGRFGGTGGGRRTDGKAGGAGRLQYAEALRRLGLPTKLARFDPRVAGTPPLGLDLPGSDIDLLCHAPDAELFTQAVWDACAHFDGFAIRQWSGRERPVIATFAAETWDFEIFGHVRPVAEQVGWRHFRVERRLLELAGPGLRAAVLRARLRGLKTEPAFAQVLALPGDPLPGPARPVRLARRGACGPADAARLPGRAGRGYSKADRDQAADDRADLGDGDAVFLVVAHVLDHDLAGLQLLGAGDDHDREAAAVGVAELRLQLAVVEEDLGGDAGAAQPARPAPCRRAGRRGPAR